ncbi:Tat (twin-arginine translocation) pathway signal sequence containing protein [Mangrovimonas sp. YM274]|uniref:Tat (twin-arginine translocation) pathway signal sequence containing protein n=1 Tax=Mangrovimonas sp. YM274 TaxID=3070660 RepID=UPI0027DB8364|nr:Tat (twin-arginine translocation) pathway signal sequence containing protein [Mangrovimonas sp. YM274]WMI69178.1 Tat (twin-arginine translocation) pathway signal sequence containing protein [Mangrovimonas sp. YM274]
MKTANTNSRRQFLGALALGATASTLSVLTNPIYANIPMDDTKKLSEAEEWFKKIKGTHRIVYDGSKPHHGFPIIWNWAFYLSNNSMGVLDKEMTAVTVLRHDAIPLAMGDSLWKKYPLGEMFKVNMSDGKAYTRNPYYEPKEGDFPMAQIEGIKRMQERGALFCVCDLAIQVYSGGAALKMGIDPKEAYQEWVNAILPGIQLVPSGVWALGRAQEHGCGYIFAGE